MISKATWLLLPAMLNLCPAGACGNVDTAGKQGATADSCPAPAKTSRLPHSVPADGVLFLGKVQDGNLIWDLSRLPDREKTNLEFPYLIRFKDRWYCSFREGDRHGNDSSGRARIITSVDGETWETAALFEREGGDIRDPRMSVTADGKLMLNSSVYFIGEQKKNPAKREQPGKRQSVTWLSEDGTNWSGPNACPTGFDTWRWDVAWHEGFGYSVGYSGKDQKGTLYRTRDGKSWEILVENFFPGGGGTEAALAFGQDGAAYCLLRGGAFYGMFGKGQAPDYKHWEWHSLQIDAAGNGQAEPGEAFGKRTGTIVGGQKLLLLSDGRLVAVTAKGGIDLFWVNPEKDLFTRFVRITCGGSYPGIVEHEGEFWITASQRVPGHQVVRSGICLIRVKVPPRASLDNLLKVAGQVLAQETKGFGSLYREQLLSARRAAASLPEQDKPDANREWAARHKMLKVLGDYREARELGQSAREALAAANASLSDSIPGFGCRYREQLRAQVEPLQKVLADDQSSIADVQDCIARLQAAAADLENARVMQARAKESVAAADGLMKESAEGFARLYQDQLRKYAGLLKEALNDPDSTTMNLSGAVEHLLDAAAGYRAVSHDAPLQAASISDAPGEVIVADESAWRAGLLVNTGIENNALVLVKKPLLSFGDKGITSVSVENPPQIAGLKKAFSIVAWGFPEAEESYRTLIDKGGRDAAFAIRHGRSIAQKNYLSARLYAEGEPHPHEPYSVGYQPEKPAEFDGSWHFYACTYDGEELKLYLDGRLVDSLAKKGNMDFSEGNLCFGCLAGGGEPWKGYIREVAIWSETLAPEKVAALMNRELRGDENGLVGYWPLNDGRGDIARDLTANANHGKITSGRWVEMPVRSGYRLSNPVRLPADPGSWTCSIAWKADAAGDPDDRADISVLYGLTGSEDALPATWEKAANGAEIPELSGNAGAGGRYLWLKQVLMTEDPTAVPRFRSIALRVK